jgi:serine/threonine protein kinase
MFSGGDLFNFIRQELGQNSISEEHAKFYVACVILALEFLH